LNRELIQTVVEEAREGEANLVVWDRRDTFTVERDELENLEVGNDHLKAKMQNGKVTVYVEIESIYKLVVEKERAIRPGLRAGFGAPGG
jgi:hypothetical protein